MKMIIMSYQGPDPWDGGIIKINNLDIAELKKNSDQLSSRIAIILWVKPCYAEFFSVFA